MNVHSNPIFGRMSGLHGLADNTLKNLISWGDHLKVGQPSIDSQHEAIFNIGMEIADSWRRHRDVGALRALTEKLGKVLEAHFRYEEGVLADIRYPKIAEHKTEHDVMLRELEVVRGRLANMKEGAAFPEPGFVVLNYLLGVTIGHIFHSDMDYCRHARAVADDAEQVWPAS